ncbi:CPBP family intramembrane glutamic endopeptidase [Oceanirhabdus sp. W0125-5]|uniref:CPBP family intramembrane glutamic endopeptidase n=1 Tax=Oceanirhabdus sp. W0125-5 TaxID=2999116 RepID=UPI0022F32929|nr:CPBP family intramembrane glutamic endopeptidase [Oceanirhabdus sp. W0125-5]WBW99675.1 CPBP family intramembrane metalloprotease [Oceanirhabdus sp. W0125-5]
MDIILTFFKSDNEYKDSLKKYDHKDGVLAIVSYLLVMIFYYVIGIIETKRNLNLSYQINFILAIFCILCVLVRKQPLKTIGFGKKNLLKSLILGLSLSAVLLIINLIYGISCGYQFNAISKLILKFGYFFFVIALVEEIIFRGFIQTRIYGIIKKPILPLLITAFMFMSMHIPYRMTVGNMGFSEFISNNYITLLCTFLWHIVFNFLYSKYNSIVAPTVFHTIINWCNVIFIG